MADYLIVRELPDGRIAALGPKRIIAGTKERWLKYQFDDEWVFEREDLARAAFNSWDGTTELVGWVDRRSRT